MNMNAPTPPQNQGSALAIPPNQSQGQVKDNTQAAALCRFGQESVQEIVSRTQDVFQTLRATQPPDGKLGHGSDRSKPKVQDTLKNIRVMYKRLRVIYDKIEELCPTTDNIDAELESSLPFKGQPTPIDEKRNSEAYLAAYEEDRELIEQVVKKNQQIRDTMDQLRLIIWDVNTMLSMRKE